MKKLFKSAAGVCVAGGLGVLTYYSDNKHLKMASAGILAQVVTDLIFHPVDLINTNTKFNFHTNPNTRDTIKKVYKAHGIPGFYRGIDALFLSSAIYGFGYFVIYKQIKESMLKYTEKEEESNILAYLTASICGESILVFYYPIDMIKTRILSYSVNYIDLRGGLENIVVKGNKIKTIKNLYAGFVTTAIYHSSSAMTCFVSFEVCRDYIANRKGIKSCDVKGWEYFFATCFAGIVTSTFTNVLEVYTIQKQVHGASVTIRSFMRSQLLYAMKSGIGTRMVYGIFYTIVLLESIKVFGKIYGVSL